MSKTLKIRLSFYSAGDRGRTGTGITTHGILSPGRLPIPPRRHTHINDNIMACRCLSCYARAIPWPKGVYHATHDIRPCCASPCAASQSHITRFARDHGALPCFARAIPWPKSTQTRLELVTSAVTGRRSNQLSHWAIHFNTSLSII